MHLVGCLYYYINDAWSSKYQGFFLFKHVLSSSHCAAYLNNKLEETWKETVVVYMQFGYFPQGHEENQTTIQVGWCLGQDSNRSPPEHKSAVSPLDATHLVPSEIELLCYNALGLTFDTFTSQSPYGIPRNISPREFGGRPCSCVMGNENT